MFNERHIGHFNADPLEYYASPTEVTIIQADTDRVEVFKIASLKSRMRVIIRGECENIRVPIRVRDRHTSSYAKFHGTEIEIELIDVIRMSLSEQYFVE